MILVLPLFLLPAFGFHTLKVASAACATHVTEAGPNFVVFFSSKGPKVFSTKDPEVFKQRTQSFFKQRTLGFSSKGPKVFSSKGP